MKKILVAFLLICWAYGKSQFCFAPFTNYGTDTSSIVICTADFNNDLKLDLATASYDSGSVSMLLGNGLGAFGTASKTKIMGNLLAMVACDVDQDGNKDLVLTKYQPFAMVQVLMGNGTGTFPVTYTYSLTFNPSALATADFNSDGFPDLAITDLYNYGVDIFLGNGNGSFGAPTPFPVDSYPNAITIGDFNSDGHADLAVCNNQGGDISVLLGNGSGGFGATTNFGSIADQRGIVAADFNSDGKTDLAALSDNGFVSLLLGTGNGGFGTASSVYVAYNGWGIASGDFNNDSKTDLAIGYNNSSGNLAILVGAGNGSFGNPYYFSTGIKTLSVIAADFNGDAFDDIACANYVSKNATVLLAVAPPPITVSGNVQTCAGAVTTLTASGVSSYTWSANGGGNLTPTVSVSPTVTTTYSVAGTLGNCVGAQAVTVSVTPLPSIAVNSASICAGASATLTASGASAYTWSPSSGLSSSTGSTVFASPNSSTVYTVVGTASGCSNSTTANVDVSSGQVNVDPMISSGCSPVCVSFSNMDNTTGTYFWDFGDGTTSSAPYPAHCYVTTNNTGYIVTLTVTDNNGCSLTGTASVNAFVVPSVSVQSYTNCAGVMDTLVPVTTNAMPAQYYWAPAPFYVSAGGDTAIVNPTSTTIYNVKVVSNYGCLDSTQSVITINCIGVNELAKKNFLRVLPVPANDYIEIAGAGEDRARVEITSSEGEILVSDDLRNKKRIDCSRLPAGIFSLRIFYANDIVVKKIVIAR